MLKKNKSWIQWIFSAIIIWFIWLHSYHCPNNNEWFDCQWNPELDPTTFFASNQTEFAIDNRKIELKFLSVTSQFSRVVFFTILICSSEYRRSELFNIAIFDSYTNFLSLTFLRLLSCECWSQQRMNKMRTVGSLWQSTICAHGQLAHAKLADLIKMQSTWLVSDKLFW